ncbi:MAG: 30S ribosomal protein S4 [Verrucomicrobia bacterium]|nr:30S ribosomal protein S4 [Verrucomicrobiota bacterium]
MARYTGPTTRINRRFGMSIFPPSKAQDRKPHPPGQHGPRLRRKVTDYSMGLNEKQKLRYLYGLTEKQFRRTFDRAKSTRGVTGEIFLCLLETRLDAVIYNIGFAKTRRQARQFVAHGHIKVNGVKVDIPSYQVSAGDVVEVRESTSSRQLATRSLEDTRIRTVPLWITRNDDALKATINRLPTGDDIEPGVNVQLIVEFYSR